MIVWGWRYGFVRVTDEQRRMLASIVDHENTQRRATRRECRLWLRGCSCAMDADIRLDWHLTDSYLRQRLGRVALHHWMTAFPPGGEFPPAA